MKNYLDKFNLGTWNVRSLYIAGALTVVEANLERYGIAIAAIQEVRWTGEGNLKSKKHTIFYSGGQRHERGVGFIVSNEYLPYIKRFEPYNDRLCYIQIECKHINLILINGYAPTEDKQQDENEAFYEDLNTIFESIAKSQPKIILGDFNAKIGKEEMYRPTIGKESLHIHSNENGNRLINFAISKGLRISSTCFPHKNIHKETWISPGGSTKNQIDHIMTDMKINNIIEDVRSHRGVSAQSDYFLVKAKIQIKLPRKWRKRLIIEEKVDIDNIKNSEMLKEYKNKLKNKLKDGIEAENIETRWKKLEGIIKTTALEHLGKKKKVQKHKWFNDKCQSAIEERDKARSLMLTNPNTENNNNFAQKLREAKRIIRREKRLWEKERIKQIEDNRTNPKLFFKQTKELKTGYNPRTEIMKEENGELVTEGEEIAKQFGKVFEELLNPQTHQDHTQIEYYTAEPEDVEPTDDEVRMIINTLKNNKSPGEDGLASELLKYGGEELIREVGKLIRDVWHKEEIPKEWQLAIICPIYKKGDRSRYQNYRGISLLNTMYKVFGKSTIDHIFTVKQLVEKHYEFDNDLHLLFIDYKQAYNSINREVLWDTLITFGIPAKIVKMIKLCMNKTRCKVRFNQHISDEFEVKTGLRQGDALSPILFNIALEMVVRKTQKKYGGVNLEENRRQCGVLAYADDIIILGSDSQEVKAGTKELIINSKDIGLQINEGKTKYMVISRRENHEENLEVENYKFERVQNFKYLGVTINSKNNNHDEIKIRLTAANKCYYGVTSILKSKQVSLKSKITIYKVIIRPVLLYACETWPTTKGDEDKLAILERRILRRIFGPKINNMTQQYEKRNNIEIQQLYKEPDIVAVLKNRRMAWAGHVWRSNGLMKEVLKWKPQGKRPLGRPKQRWIDKVEKNLAEIGIRDGEIIAQDRDRWKQVCVAVMGLNGL
ncbi:hypothetical protein QTP88_000521 [Uroleucon formosanum]